MQQGALGKIGTPAVEPLLAALKDEDSGVRSKAARALGEIKDTRAVEPLISALEDEDPGVRWNVAYALGEIKDARAVEPLIATLEDEDPGVRENAAIALGEIKDARAVEPLITALKDKDKDVRRHVAWALGEIKDARAVEFLIIALKDKDLAIVTGAYSFFIRRGEQESIPILIDALNEYGYEEMATDFLNCGNGQLEKAGRVWLRQNGYEIKSVPGGSGPQWGSKK